MNKHKLKQLFSPNTLAAVVSTGLLLGSAVVAWAEHHDSAIAYYPGVFPGCGGERPKVCSGWHGSQAVYWCCVAEDECGGLVDGFPSPMAGWCDYYP